MPVGNIYVIAAVSVIGGGLFGFDISSMSAIIPGDPYRCYFDQSGGKCLGPKSDVQGGITAAMPGGSWAGAIASGFISDIYGRKKAIMLGCLIWIVGCIIVSASQNIGMLIVGRVICGICVGIESAQVPVYISELAPPSKRGRLVGAQQWAITWGILIMFYLSYGCSFIKGTGAFRVPWALQMIPALLLFFGMMLLPESPRWYASKDRWEECMKVLVLVHGKGDPESPFVKAEYEEIKAVAELERQFKDVTFLELLKPNMINRTHIGVFTQIWSQLTGMNVMMYYISYVFTMAGLTDNTLLLSSSIQYVINVGMTVPALIYVDRWGRRPVLLIGAAFMMTWLFANAGILATYGHYTGPDGINNIPEASTRVSGAASKAVIACSYLFVASFAISWGPVSWIYPPELYPLRVRGKAVALATSANWAMNFALSYFVPPAFVNIQWRTYIIFGVFCIAMFIHVFFLFPETAGKRLEEIEDMFTNPNGPKYIGTWAWKTSTGTSAANAREAGQIDDDMRKRSFAKTNSHDSGSPGREEKMATV